MQRILPKRRVDGVTTALVTPFDERGDLNLTRVNPLVEFNLKHGIIGFFVCGSTGEGLLLSLDERRAMAEEVTQQVAGRAAVLIHVGKKLRI